MESTASLGRTRRRVRLRGGVQTSPSCWPSEFLFVLHAFRCRSAQSPSRASRAFAGERPSREVGLPASYVRVGPSRTVCCEPALSGTPSGVAARPGLRPLSSRSGTLELLNFARRCLGTHGLLIEYCSLELRVIQYKPVEESSKAKVRIQDCLADRGEVH